MKTVNNEYRINAALGAIADLRAAIQSDEEHAARPSSCFSSYGGMEVISMLENYMTLIDGIEFYLTQKD